MVPTVHPTQTPAVKTFLSRLGLKNAVKCRLDMLLLVGVCCLMSQCSTEAQGVVGTWKGTLKLSSMKLPLVLHVRDSAGQLMAAMDSPNQAAYGIPLTSVRFQDSILHFELTANHIRYEGQLQPDGDTIMGTFTQMGTSMPLELIRSLTAAEPGDSTAVQEPRQPFPYRSENVDFKNPNAHITLRGTLTLPKQGGPFPTAVLISGSGPQDRNEALFAHKPFLVISDYLTRKGIAVLRFDDRGTAKSEGNFQSATTADFATDVAAAVAYLNTRKEINQQAIGLIGHSEGGLVASMVAAKNKNIAFVVLLAGPGLDGTKIMLTQEAAIERAMGVNPEAIAKAATLNQKIFDLIKTTSDTSALADSLTRLLTASLPPQTGKTQGEKIVAEKVSTLTNPWIRYFLQIDPAIYLKQVKCPVLALDGSHDLQVVPKQNIAAIKEALASGGNKNVSTKIFPDLNHLFQQSKTGLSNEYASIKQTFAPQVLALMKDWILQQVKTH